MTTKDNAQFLEALHNVESEENLKIIKEFVQDELRTWALAELEKQNLIPKIIKIFESASGNARTQAAYIILSFSAGDERMTNLLMNAGVLQTCIHFLKSATTKPQAEANWDLITACVNIIGNMALENNGIKQQEIQFGVIPLLLNIVSLADAANSSTSASTHATGDVKPINVLRYGIWAISNILRLTHVNDIGLGQLKQITTDMAALLLKTSDNKVILNILTLLSRAPYQDEIQLIVDTGIIPHVISLLENSIKPVIQAAVTLLGSVLAGHDNQAAVVIKAGFIDAVKPLFSLGKETIIKACWALSNAAASAANVEDIISHELIPRLLAILSSQSLQVKTEAMHCICNTLCSATPEQNLRIVDYKLIKELCDLLKLSDEKLLLLVLTSLQEILGKGVNFDTGVNDFAAMVEEYGGLDRLEALQHHQSQNVYVHAVDILENYFDAEVEDAEMPDTDKFTFGSSGSFPSGSPQGFDFEN